MARGVAALQVLRLQPHLVHTTVGYDNCRIVPSKVVEHGFTEILWERGMSEKRISAAQALQNNKYYDGSKGGGGCKACFYGLH